MSRRSILEYAQALRSRYFGATREENSKMLDEFTQVTGLHRKAALRLLPRLVPPRAGKRRWCASVHELLSADHEVGD